MLKDSTKDPLFAPIGGIPSSYPQSNSHESIFGDNILDYMVINGNLKHQEKEDPTATTLTLNTMNMKNTNTPLRGQDNGNGKTPRSSHKIVTPIRRQTASFLVESLESLFNDSQDVNDHIISKITNSALKGSPAVINSYSGLSPNPNALLLSTLGCSDRDELGDPQSLQSHIQKSFEGIGFDRQQQQQQQKNQNNNNNQFVYNNSCSASPLVLSTSTMWEKKSLYSTPIRCKQSKSQDSLDLPRKRLHQRRSSLVLPNDSLATFTFSFDSSSSDLSLLNDFEQQPAVSVTSGHENTNGSTSNMLEEATWNASSESIIINNVDGDGDGDDSEAEEEDFSGKRSSSFCASITDSGKKTFSLPNTAQIDNFKDGSKPPYSYASLIAQAIISSPKQRLALSSIYNWIMQTYPYYQLQSCGWQVS